VRRNYLLSKKYQARGTLGERLRINTLARRACCDSSWAQVRRNYLLSKKYQARGTLGKRLSREPRTTIDKSGLSREPRTAIDKARRVV
jgi:predicted metal-dependent RNase